MNYDKLIDEDKDYYLSLKAHTRECLAWINGQYVLSRYDWSSDWYPVVS